MCGDLPTGMTLLQASAGTGKTFTIAALTTRYVAEGILPIDRLLVITFTRMATGELRERVRERLVRAFDGLVDLLDGAGGHEDDELVQLLANAPAEEVEIRRDRLGKAIANFDAATIETTHGFCLQVLYGLGTAGDVDREVTLVEDVNDLMEEVVDDLFLRKFATRTNSLKFTRAEAMEIARHALATPTRSWCRPCPTAGHAVPPPPFRRGRARGHEHAKRARKILTYDDVLLRLRDTLADPERGPAACARLRERFDVVLVDEFQDTDPVQWDIMRAPSAKAASTLGADRRPQAGDLRVPWCGRPRLPAGPPSGAVRMDPRRQLAQRPGAPRGLRRALWRRASRVRRHRVSPDPRRRRQPAVAARRRARAGASPAADRARGDGLVPVTPKQGLLNKDEARNADRQRPRGRRRRAPLRAGRSSSCGGATDASSSESPCIRATSQCWCGSTPTRCSSGTHSMRVGVPAVIGGAGSVFATEPAQEWLRLLEALERPTARDRAALAASTCFVGWTANEVATASEEAWEDLHWSLHRWAALLRDQGIAALFETVTGSRWVPRRVLTRASGERFMTDLRHVAQLLHEAGVSEGLGPTALATWLGRRIHDAERDAENEERARRLESDADAVQVITIHRSKGLEFPIVYCPYVWDGYAKATRRPGVPRPRQRQQAHHRRRA